MSRDDDRQAVIDILRRIERELEGLQDTIGGYSERERYCVRLALAYVHGARLEFKIRESKP